MKIQTNKSKEIRLICNAKLPSSGGVRRGCMTLRVSQQIKHISINAAIYALIPKSVSSDKGMIL
jgi:hypothetical protein